MKMPDRNLNTLDRVTRGVVGVVTLYFGLFGTTFIGDPIVQTILVVFGLANIVSLFTGWCIVYHFVGISTIKAT